MPMEEEELVGYREIAEEITIGFHHLEDNKHKKQLAEFITALSS